MPTKIILSAVMLAALSALVTACEERGGDKLAVVMHAIDDSGPKAALGTMQLAQTASGLSIEVNLTGLPPGPHGMHVHQNGDCGPPGADGRIAPGLAAGGHYDPTLAGHHGGPDGQGHKGDLPHLRADAEGRAQAKLLAPRLRLDEIRGRAIIIHAKGDNYSDSPKTLGGGGARIACGLID